MQQIKKILMLTVIVGLFLTLILEFVSVLTSLQVKTLEMQKLEWQITVEKTNLEVAKLQKENELTRFRVYATLEDADYGK